MTATDSQSAGWSRPADVAILVLKNLDHDARVLKESQTFAAAGLNVVRVGIITRSSEPEWEQTGHDRILRLRTTDRLAAERPDNAAPVVPKKRGLLGDLRYWLGRRRENRIAADAVARLKPKVVVACDLNTLRAGYLLKQSIGCRLIYDAHELFTEMSPRKSWLYRTLWGTTERHLIRHADRVITVNSQRAEVFAKRYGIAEPDVVLNGPQDCLGECGELGSPLRLVYQGSLSPSRGLDTLMKAMVSVRGKAVLSLQGFGANREHLAAIAAELDLEDTVRFIEPVAPDQVVHAAAEHDVGVVIYRATTLNDYLAAPNKLLDYMGAGLAIIGSRLPMIEEIVEREQVGVLFEPDDLGSLEAALQQLVSDTTDVAAMKQRAAAACECYAWPAQEQTLLAAAGIGVPQ